MPEHIIVEKAGNVGKINFNRDRRMNALMPEMLEEIMAALSGFGQDAEVRAVVFTGNGRAFSSGADMKFLEPLFEMKPFEIKKEVYSSFGGAIKTLKLFPKPTIAAVNGPAFGAGCELALACDFRIASEQAVFCERWIGLGLIPPLGGMFLLPRLIGLAKATEMIMLGTEVDGTEAAKIGLAN
ncbi:MAG: enoyl-CoA hydratase/isomerase family protein, partial [bacterium]